MEDFKKEEMKIEMLCAEMEELFKKTKEVAEKYRELDFSQLTSEDFKEAFDIMKDTAEAKMYITKAHKNMAEAKYYCTLVEAMKESTYGEDYDEEGPIEKAYYRGQPRSQSSGRFMSRGDGRRNYGSRYYNRRVMPDYNDDIMWYSGRDMDRGYGRMYYPDSMRSTGTSTSTGSGMPRQNPNEVANDMGMDSNEGNNRFYGDGNRSGRNDRMNYQESDFERSRRTYMETKEKHKGNSVEDNKMKMDKLNELGDSLEDSLTELVNDMNEQERKMWKQRIISMGQNIK